MKFFWIIEKCRGQPPVRCVQGISQKLKWPERGTDSSTTSRIAAKM